MASQTLSWVSTCQGSYTADVPRGTSPHGDIRDAV